MPKDGQPRGNEKSTMALKRRDLLLSGTSLVAVSALSTFVSDKPAHAQQQMPEPPGRKPNMLVIFGDDVGVSNISAYSNGLMGYETPNIDRIGREGIMDEVFKFVATFEEFPPRSFPPSFVPTTIMEQTVDDIKDARRRNTSGSRALQ